MTRPPRPNWPLFSVLPPMGALATAPRAARMHLRDTLKQWGLPEVIEDGELIASELVTNVVGRAHDPVTGMPVCVSDRLPVLRFGLFCDRMVLLISVWDQFADPPVRKIATADDESGRGLMMAGCVSAALDWHPVPGREGRPGVPDQQHEDSRGHVMRFREDKAADRERARAAVAQWREQNPAGTEDQMIAALGSQFHPEYGPVLRAVLVTFDRHRARTLTGAGPAPGHPPPPPPPPPSELSLMSPPGQPPAEVITLEDLRRQFGDRWEITRITAGYRAAIRDTGGHTPVPRYGRTPGELAESIRMVEAAP